MKKIISLLLVLFTLGFSAYADDKPITQEQLPAPAQQFIKKYFPAAKIAYATVDKDLVGKSFKGVPVVKIERDRKGYDVELQNKLEIKFDSKFNVLEYDD